MATRKTAAKKATTKTNQQAARQRTTAASKATSAEAAVPPSPVVTGPTLSDAPMPLHQAAAALTSVQAVTAGQPQVQQLVSQRLSDVEQAVALRAQQAQAHSRAAQLRAEAAELERQANVSPAADAPVMQLAAAMRAPMTNPTQKPVAVEGAGISPDVTSPISAPGANGWEVPGTGVAELTDLAPGQDLSPSPPISSSNIAPLPNKPGSLYSKL